MKRSEVATIYHKTKSIEGYNNLDVGNITDNKKSWKTLKPMSSDKAKCESSKINLVENDEILSPDKETAEACNKYFINAVKSLNLQCDFEHLNDVSDETNPIERAIKKFKNHPNIININKNIPKTTNFEFSQVILIRYKK